nr:glycosyltransferase [Paraglaciecola sp. G1-23]
MFEQALTCYPKSITKLEIVKPGVDSDHFRPKTSREDLNDLRTKLLLPKDKKIILGVGRFVPAKGFDLLIQACSKLKSDWHLVIIGNGRDHAHIVDIVDRLNLNNRVSLPGKVQNTNEYYRCADTFIMSSRYEPLGQTLLEAMSCGVPIISFKHGGEIVNATQEVVGQLAFFPISNTVSSLGNSIDDFFSLSESDVENLSKKLRNYSIKNYSWHLLADKLACSVKD